MPQLDLYSIGNQFFWGLIFFVTFYFLISFYIIPAVFSSMFARSEFSDSLGSSSAILLSYCFVFISFVNSSQQDILQTTDRAVNDLYTNKFLYNIALNNFISSELAGVYELNYFNDEEE